MSNFDLERKSFSKRMGCNDRFAVYFSRFFLGYQILQTLYHDQKEIKECKIEFQIN